MKSIQVYDPPMCCSTGVCGPDVDPVLPWFSGILTKLSEAGVKVERFNLARQPLEYVRNATVKSLLEGSGTDALPAIFVDGALALNGAYPDEARTDAWLAATPASAPA